MDPSSPATKQDQPSPTQAAEEEVAASLLLLKESIVEVSVEVEKEASDKTALVTYSLVDGFSADEALDEAQKNESPEQEDKNEEQEGDDDDELEEEEVEEYEVQRCNRNNGRGWFCNEVAEPGFATCLPHLQSRRDSYQKFRLKKLQGSTSRSEATVEHKIGDATATSAVGDQKEAAGSSSPGTLARAKRRKAGDPAVLDDEAA